MAYMYPKISNCLIYKKCDADSVEITDYLTDEIYTMGIEEMRYVRKLDGKTHPYKINTTLMTDEIDNLIQELDEYGLLKESNLMMTSGGTFLRTIWEPKWTIFLRLIAFLCNHILLISWLPIFIVGIIMFKNSFLMINFEYLWLGTIVGLISGVILHEFGHAFAGVSYGAKVFEIGLMVMYFIIPGAYAILDEKPVKNRLKRVQIYAAGVETNIFLTGLFLILGAIFNRYGGMFLSAAINNVLLAVLNLTLIDGFDGTAIISELLGIENVAQKAARVFFNKRERRKIANQGLSGKATVITCYLICTFQVALPLLLILNVLEVIVCFV